MKHTESLRENHDFRRLYARGKNKVTPYLVVYAQKNRFGKSRLGLTTGKKIGCAVERNRARRLMRESFRLLEPQIRRGYDIVLVARVKTVHAKQQKVGAALYAALDGLGLIRKEGG